MGKLTAVAVRGLISKGKPGAHADGGNLYLRVAAPGRAKWTFRFKLAGASSREMFLGSAADMTLADARLAAQEAHAIKRRGADPIKARAAQKASQARQTGQTFADVAALYIDSHRSGWRNQKHAAQWTSTLTTHVFPIMGAMPIAEVDTDAVMKVLEPIWRKVPETATRVRGRIESILDYATARKWRTGDNPARWRGHVATMLPARGKIARVVHHAALPWPEMPAFMAALSEQAGIGALALRFAILTAARSGEVRGATWGELDMAARVWTIPGDRMKAGREHRVPLSDDAIAILQSVRIGEPAALALVFPSPVRSRPTPLSDMSLTAVLRRMGRGDLTAHGFRSSFRDWCSESTNYPSEVAEMALAHTVADKVEAAYRRGDLFDRRRRLMDDWAAFCRRGEVVGAEVVPLRA